jgi:small-conductance mechanosensitive channel
MAGENHAAAASLSAHFQHLMLATIAVVLIVIWAIGFFARLVGHIIHAVLLVAFLLLVAHYFRMGKLDRFGHDATQRILPHEHERRNEGR